jgi:RNA polymerase sigma-70 factor (ECF subfamily)
MDARTVGPQHRPPARAAPTSDLTDAIELARGGDERAWRAIYRELAPPVIGYLRGQGAPEPEDLAGEVFVQVVRDLPRFAGDERGFRAWVLTIAHRRLVDDRRRRGRRPVATSQVSGSGDERAVASSERTAPDAGGEALDRIGRDRVRSLIDALPPDQRSVLLLRLVGDLTVREVASALGKREGAVKALQRRGLAAIRRRIEREGVTL